MRIGDTVFVHGIVDEIRKDTVIIRNNGGYFGTVAGEIITGDMSERKKGKWIDDEFIGQYRCSECDYYSIDEYDFCPNCGADLREDQDDQRTDEGD